MKIAEISEEIYQVNKSKGFWKEGRKLGDPDRNFAEACMLLVTEVAEAVEADRKGHRANLEGFANVIESSKAAIRGRVGDHQEKIDIYRSEYKAIYERYVKDSIEAELAGTAIRLFDIAYGFGIDLEKFIRLEVDYNKLREARHGKRY